MIKACPSNPSLTCTHSETKAHSHVLSSLYLSYLILLREDHSYTQLWLTVELSLGVQSLKHESLA